MTSVQNINNFLQEKKSTLNEKIKVIDSDLNKPIQKYSNQPNTVFSNNDKLENSKITQGKSKPEINFIKKDDSNESKDGLWVWNINDIPNSKTGSEMDTFLKLAAQKGIDRIYVNGYPSLISENKTDFWKKLVIKAAENNIKVEVLLGNHEWIVDKDQEKTFKTKFLNSFVNFWKVCPENAKPSIHLDIEPHQLNNWSNNKITLIEKTISLYEDVNTILKNSGINTEITADIPHWWDNIKLSNGKSAFENISEKVSTVVLMSYGANSEKVENFSKRELASPSRKKVVVGIETDALNLIEDGAKGEEIQKAISELYKSPKNMSIHPKGNTKLSAILSVLPDKKQ